MISVFPELCKPAFVADGSVTSQRVIDMLKPHLADKRQTMNDEERRVWNFLVDFANHVTEEGKKVLLSIELQIICLLFYAGQTNVGIAFLTCMCTFSIHESCCPCKLSVQVLI